MNNEHASYMLTNSCAQCTLYSMSVFVRGNLHVLYTQSYAQTRVRSTLSYSKLVKCCDMQHVFFRRHVET